MNGSQPHCLYVCSWKQGSGLCSGGSGGFRVCWTWIWVLNAALYDLDPIFICWVVFSFLWVFLGPQTYKLGLPSGARGKELTCQCSRHRDAGSVSGSKRSPGGGYGNPLWCSCLKNLLDRGGWQATVHGVDKSQTRLSDLICTHLCELDY